MSERTADQMHEAQRLPGVAGGMQPTLRRERPMSEET